MTFGLSGIGESYTVGDDMGVTLETALGDTVAGLVTGAVWTPSSDKYPTKQIFRYPRRKLLQVPDDQSLVARAGQEHVGVLERSGKALKSSNQFGRPSNFPAVAQFRRTVTQPLCPLS